MILCQDLSLSSSPICYRGALAARARSPLASARSTLRFLAVPSPSFAAGRHLSRPQLQAATTPS